MYDTIHLNGSLPLLYSEGGDTFFRYSDLTSLNVVTIQVKVRVDSSSSYLSAFYLPSYIERPPTGGATFNSLTLGTSYSLNVSNPYFTVVVISNGGASTYTLEYGRVDERQFAAFAVTGVAKNLLIMIGLLCLALIG